MDIATAIGLFMGCMTVAVLVLMDGSFGIYLDKHAFIVIFGGAISATLIRYPMSMMLHGLPMGLRFAFQMRKLDPRGLIEEITNV